MWFRDGEEAKRLGSFCMLLLVFLLVFGLIWVYAQTASAQVKLTQKTSNESFYWLGFVFGYFLAYTIRHGSKTQDAFKGFLGVLGVGTSGLSVKLLQDADSQTLALVEYTWGTIGGGLVYMVIALALVVIYAWRYNPGTPPPNQTAIPVGLALFAETLGKVLLGEDFRPRP